MIINIINHPLHSVTGCIRHIPCLITGRKLFKLLNDLIINLINVFHIGICQCIKKCLFRATRIWASTWQRPFCPAVRSTRQARGHRAHGAYEVFCVCIVSLCSSFFISLIDVWFFLLIMMIGLQSLRHLRQQDRRKHQRAAAKLPHT